MARISISINGQLWTKTDAERVISSAMWGAWSAVGDPEHPLPAESQLFIQRFVAGGPQDTLLRGLDRIGVQWLYIGRRVPTLVFGYLDGTRRRVSYKSLRLEPSKSAERQELRMLRSLTADERKRHRKIHSHHVDDVAPGTFQWRARLFKKYWLKRHPVFNVRNDNELQARWVEFYQLFQLESVSPSENYSRKTNSDRSERVQKLVEASAPAWVRLIEIDRAALWVIWRNQGGWDVPEIGYFESEWSDISPLEQGRVRSWLSSLGKPRALASRLKSQDPIGIPK